MPSLPSHPALAPRHLPVPLKDLGMLMQEHPIKLVELVGFNRSNVLCGALRSGIAMGRTGSHPLPARDLAGLRLRVLLKSRVDLVEPALVHRMRVGAHHLRDGLL